MKSSLETLRFTKPLRALRATAAHPVLISAAELEVEFERGRRVGEGTLGEQLLRQRAELVSLQSGLFQSLRQALPRVRQECEAALIALTLEVARKLVGGMSVSSELVEAVVREALQELESKTEVTVLLHADDLAMLERTDSALLTAGPAEGGLRFQASAEVKRGGCILQTRFGVCDAQRETKLSVIRQALEIS
jgi:flagellar assembly protein FliH